MGREDGLHPQIVAGFIVLVIKQTLGSTDPFCTAGSQYLLAVLHIEQLIFQGSASHIANQNIHIELLRFSFILTENCL
jgi:hypothetical protein